MQRTLHIHTQLHKAKQRDTNNTQEALTDLNELGDLAHLHAEVPETEEVLSSRGRQTDENHQQIRHRQVHQENVGGAAHARVAPDGEADEAVAAQADDEDDEEKHDEEPAEDDGDEGLVQVVVVVVVVLVVDAAIVGEVVGEVQDEGCVEGHIVAAHRSCGGCAGTLGGVGRRSGVGERHPTPRNEHESHVSVHPWNRLLYGNSARFSLGQDGISALGKAHMCSTPSPLGLSPNAAFETEAGEWETPRIARRKTRV